MIRASLKPLLILLGLLIGLALAAVFEGRISHLRRIAGDRLPEWSKALSADAGLAAGTLSGVAGLLPGGVPVDLHWRFSGLDLAGAWYRIDLDNEAGTVDLQGRLHLPFGGGGWRGLEFSGGEGVIDLGPLYTAPRDLPLRGRLLLVDGAGVFDAEAGQLRRFSGLASLAEGQFDGVDLGLMRFVIQTGDAGEWLADVSASGGALSLQAQARGGFDSSVFALEGQIKETPDLPERWQRALNQNLPKDTEGWRLPETMDFQAPQF